MSSNNINDQVIIHDGRQSETAAAIQRGLCRMLRQAGHTTLTELVLPTGRRADVLSVSAKGEIWIIEIKSSLADFRADNKWPEYRAFCDRLFFAKPIELADEIFPPEAGLIVADAYGAEILRMAKAEKLAAARRKAMTLLVARTAMGRLQAIYDPASNN